MMSLYEMSLHERLISIIEEYEDMIEKLALSLGMEKKGDAWIGKCPFHEEKTGSFVITPSKGIYHCFGCGKGGTIEELKEQIQKRLV